MRFFALISTLFMIGVTTLFYGCAKEKAIGTSAKIVNLDDILLSIGYTGEMNYSIDLDGNSKPDFTFSLWGQVNGYGSWRGITLKSADSTYFPGEFVTDVNGIDTSQAKIVRIFNQGDTVRSKDCLEQVLTMTHYSDGKNPPKVYVSVDNWFAGGGHFVGFKKTMNGIVQLGWINVEVLSYDAIRLKAYAITERNAAVNELIIACGK